MVLRFACVVAAMSAVLGSALPAAAQEMNAEQARRFVIGKTFAYQCFDGTKGAGRIMSDGSVAGTVQGANGGGRYMVLPANTVHVSGEKVCASVRGIPFQPCFNLTKLSERSFRGAIQGLGFAYCDFTRSGPTRNNVIRASVSGAEVADASGASKPAGKPMVLRSSLAE